MNLLFGNFDFENHLGRSRPRTLPALVQRINAELAYSLVTIAKPGDFVWAAEPSEPDYTRHLSNIARPGVRFVRDPADVPVGTHLMPWGWTADLTEWGKQHGWRCDCPDLAVVATANSREFSSSLEREWGVGLPQARTVRNPQELDEAVNDSTRQSPDWVVKANFGMSARERFLGRGSPPGRQATQWVKKQLAQEEAVYFEPWVERIEEFGFQFTIPHMAKPMLEGITPLLTDHLGTYRGSRLRPTSGRFARADEIGDVLRTVTRAAERIQQLGYFGPLGIDAMLYRSADGQPSWRPLQDVNARLTMGRLALGLRDFVPELKHATWLRARAASAGTAEELGPVLDRLPDATEIVHTSPLWIGDRRPVSGISFLITADTTEALFAAEALCKDR